MSGIQLIVGHVTDTTARVWVRSPKLRYAIIEVSQAGTQVWSKTLEVNSWNGYAGAAEATGLAASTAYDVSVRFAATKSPPQVPPAVGGSFRTFPPASSSDKFTFLLGSCNLDGNTPFEQLRGNVIAKETPSFMVHCGDQIYADIPFLAPPGLAVDHWRNRYLAAWSGTEAAAVLGSLPHYMILDDHEVANDFKNHMSPISHIKAMALKAYGEFQHSHNPQTNGAQH